MRVPVTVTASSSTGAGFSWDIAGVASEARLAIIANRTARFTSLRAYRFEDIVLLLIQALTWGADLNNADTKHRHRSLRMGGQSFAKFAASSAPAHLAARRSDN